MTGLLIFWRSAKVSRGTGDKKYINGLIVSFSSGVITGLFFYDADNPECGLISVITDLTGTAIGVVVVAIKGSKLKYILYQEKPLKNSKNKQNHN